ASFVGLAELRAAGPPTAGTAYAKTKTTARGANESTTNLRPFPPFRCLMARERRVPHVPVSQTYECPRMETYPELANRPAEHVRKLPPGRDVKLAERPS